MRKLCLFVASFLVVLMLSCTPAFADASPNGCKHSDDKASGCSAEPTPAPEPGSLGLLAAGILVVGGAAAVVGRKRFLHN
jgi:hypothetical protein